MHEFSVVQGIVEAVIETAQANKAHSVHDIILEIGELTFLGKEQMIFSFDALKEDTILENSKLVIKEKNALVRCGDCGYEGPPANCEGVEHITIPILKCPECNKFGMEILQGKDCIIKGVNLEVE